jgi:hypothetical protein
MIKEFCYLNLLRSACLLYSFIWCFPLVDGWGINTWRKQSLATYRPIKQGLQSKANSVQTEMTTTAIIVPFFFLNFKEISRKFLYLKVGIFFFV